MQMEHRLPRTRSHVHDHTVVLESLGRGDLGHEPQHTTRFLVRECVDLAERVDVPLGEDEKVGLGGRLDVADRDEAFGGVDVVAALDELAEEAVRLRQRPTRPRPRHRRLGRNERADRRVDEPRRVVVRVAESRAVDEHDVSASHTARPASATRASDARGAARCGPS